MWAMVKAANEAESERLKNITTRLIANLMCDYKLVHLVVDNLGVKVRLCARTPLLSPPSLPASRLFLCTLRLVGVCRSSRPVRAVVGACIPQSLIAISKTSNSPTTKLWCATAIRQLSWHPKLLPRLVSEGVIPGGCVPLSHPHSRSICCCCVCCLYAA
jgi:hypothetical protein